MARTKIEGASSLLNALNFAKVAWTEDGELPQQCVILHNKCLIASNGTLSAGVPIEEEITACPQGHLLRAALMRCKESFSLTIERQAMRVRSGPFRASIECLPFGALRAAQADAAAGPLPDSLKATFAALAPLIDETAPRLFATVLALGPNYATVASARVIAQAWHGVPLPARFLLPKAAIDAVKNSAYALVSLGYSRNSVTFHFDNGAWIKSQLLHDEKYPDTDRFFADTPNYQPFPKGFNDAVRLLAPMATENNVIRYGPKGLILGERKEVAAFEIEGLPTEVAFDFEEWQTLGARVTHADWLSDKNAIRVVGDGIRGTIAKVIIYDESNIPF